ncbi:MAG: hypothetical protein HC880_19035 [Bacteroidia bacterium]|nr:hypothetical protein [Bacteroidia bacterium]
MAHLNALPNLLVSYHRDEKDKPEYPDIPIKSVGLSDIEKVEDKCLKFKIFYNDSLKTTPLLMYEKMYGKKFRKGEWFYHLGQRPVLNSFILNYRIRNYDYTQDVYPSVYLGEWIDLVYQVNPFGEKDLLALLEAQDPASDTAQTAEGDEPGQLSEDESLLLADIPADTPENPYTPDRIDRSVARSHVYELTKDKIIFVGDFEDRDMHETIYGDTPGPIILLDAFLALEAGDNAIRPALVAFLYFFFVLISYISFRYRTIYGPWLQRLTQRTRATFFEALSIYLLYFAIVSISTFSCLTSISAYWCWLFICTALRKPKGI